MYLVTVTITPQPNNPGRPAAPRGTQQLSITIGTCSSDQLAIGSAAYSGHQVRLIADGCDVNIRALVGLAVESARPVDGRGPLGRRG